MATQVQDTQDLIVALQQNPSPQVELTQDCVVVVVHGRAFAGVTPSFFNLQKLVLTVKESNVPVRGRNQ